MKNKNIEKLTSILSPMMLDINTSLARRRFVRHLKDFIEDYNDESDAIKKEFCEKKPDGSPKTVNQLIEFTPENKKKANEKFRKLRDLDIRIDWSGEEKDKEIVIGLLEKELTKLKEPKVFNDMMTQTIVNYEEILEELKTPLPKEKKKV